MQLSGLRRSALSALPPMYTWPAPVKRVILTLASVACVLAYLMLLVGFIGAIVMFYSLG